MKLKDVIEEFISGDWGLESSEDGFSQTINCVRGADFVPISNNTFEAIPQRYVNAKSFNNRRLSEADLIIEKSGGSPTQSTGRIAYVSEALLESCPNLLCSNFCIAIRVKRGWNARFVYYYWQHLYNNGVFFNFEGKTSGLKNLQLDSALSAIEIPEYSLDKQRQIANTLETIENKIALNQQINRNLEAMIRLITDELFFSKRNQLVAQRIGDVAHIKAGGDCPTVFSKELTTSCCVPVFSNGTDKEGLYGFTKEPIIRRRSITVAARGTIGYCVRRKANYVPIIRLLSVAPKIQGGDTYLHQVVSRIKFEKNGSVQQQLTVPELSNIVIPYPSESQLRFYEDITRPIVNIIEQNADEIERLITLRDFLLPQLMNGQVSVMPREANYDLSPC